MVGVIFAVTLFILSIAINFMCIKKRDDITAFEKVGAGLCMTARMGKTKRNERGSAARSFLRSLFMGVVIQGFCLPYKGRLRRDG